MSKSSARHRQPSTMANPLPFLSIALVFGVPLVLYIIFLCLSAIPFFQRK
jgi:hypothetical protein